MSGPNQSLANALVAAPQTASRTAVLRGVGIAATVLLSIAPFLLLVTALHAARGSANSIAALERGQLLSRRIAVLAGEYAMGERDTRSDLRSAISALAAVARSTSSSSDATAEPAVNDFLAAARRIAAISPNEPQLRPAAGALLEAADITISARFDQAAGAQRATADRRATVFEIAALFASLTLLSSLGALALLVVRPIVRRAKRLAAEAAELARVATTDPLTGLLNRRSFQDRGAIELNKAKRYDRPLSMLMIDPDHFETIAKAHGGDASDIVLKALTAALFDGTRATDLVGRVGGEEFAILLPETGPDGAALLAERLRTRIGALSVPVKNSVISCTVSIGVSAAKKDTQFFSATFARADEALFEAKMRGRNRVFNGA